MLGPGELAIIGVVAALIFGPRQLPKLGKALGETIKELKNAGKELRTGVADVEAEVAGAKRAVEDALDDSTEPEELRRRRESRAVNQ